MRGMDGREDTNIKCGVEGSPRVGNPISVDWRCRTMALRAGAEMPEVAEAPTTTRHHERAAPPAMGGAATEASPPTRGGAAVAPRRGAVVATAPGRGGDAAGQQGRRGPTLTHVVS
jgi:hypothetical protein